MAVIDCDMHFFETPDTWATYADPDKRHLALRLEDDELGYPWLMRGDTRISLAEPHVPGNVDKVGEHRSRRRAGLPPELDYHEMCGSYADMGARLAQLDTMGVDEAVCFPNYGLLWERPLSDDLDALHTNMSAWNRYAADVRAEGAGRLHPVGHVTLRDIDWLDRELESLSATGVRLAFMAPALVDGMRLSDPALDAAWSAFEAHGVTPVFHVGDQPRIFDDAWFGDEPDSAISVLRSVFLWTPVALALSDLILGGVLERHPDLRLGVMELSAVWVPLHLMMLDGGLRFSARFEGDDPTHLPLTPSEYFRRQVRVAAFSYERPDKLIRQAGDVFMACSDYPHAEGSATPVEDYAGIGMAPADAPALFADNIRYLLRA